ncbi:Exodeoxyribonuclease 7 small subunit [Candidatus Providencia siddallii]|uniref:Exodeoxyribonuclease 7 small subunit n=1 Tax=Candidatus Providencia siddallii TaxID=1715285 RepID=A0A0M6W6T0_9GAMM|nr:Exodeoxyribonuclease 7 small subunit [Candidatus Providencia siddallii]
MNKEKPKNNSKISFEDSLKELEQIVTSLESGNLSLEDAISEFERGIRIAKISKEILQNAEQRVQVLLTDDENKQLEDFSPITE